MLNDITDEVSAVVKRMGDNGISKARTNVNEPLLADIIAARDAQG